MSEIDDEKVRLFVRAARGDGSGIITMPKEMQQEARRVVLDNWTDWALSYLLECGHHPDEINHVAPSLRDVLAKWWDARNSFDTSDDPHQIFPEGRDWNVFWAPATAPIEPDDIEPGKSDP